MQESPARTEFHYPQELRPKDARKAIDDFCRLPLKRGDILQEDAFRAMLALERRRADRSRQPFVLMLLNASAVVAQQGPRAVLSRLIVAISGATRESDLLGWYQEGKVLGVIFTELGEGANCKVTEILNSKISAALQEKLDAASVSMLVLTFHVFPEQWDNAGRDQVADLKLYPDVSSRSPKKKFPVIVKRLIDIIGGTILLLIHSPILAAVAVAIKLTSKGPVIFRQERLGQFGKSFSCLKFRTMYVGNDSTIHREYVESFIAGKVKHKGKRGVEPAVYKIKDDPRVTPVGRFLRKTSLDEFPQFWNVLSGEMSLVGPRPPLPYEFQAYDFWHRRRVLDVKPGVTGLWQILGRSRTNFDDMVRMDLQYCQRWSIWLDLKILLATPLAVLTGNGAY